MARRQYWLFALFGLLQTAAFAQEQTQPHQGVEDLWKDSSKISTKQMPQYNEFVNNQFPYPARPRDQWELGLGLGYSLLIADMDTRPGGGISVHARKALGHVVSFRAEYTASLNYGLDYKLTAAADNPYGTGDWVRNYKNFGQQLDLDIVASLNTLSHYRGNPKHNIYVFGGYSFVAGQVSVDATTQDYSGVSFTGSRRDIKSAVRDVLDGDYETQGFEPNGSRDPIGRTSNGTLLRHGVNAGLGVSFRLTPKLNMGIEQKFTMPFSDDFDGVREGVSRDYYSLTSIKFGWHMGKPGKRVVPLWWINPNNYIYNELNVPKHMKVPPPVLKDGDGDGVTDQFDLEPNTPAGVRVDARGRALDTDNDGVPDFKDKELLTPVNCFPVDADGVGTCPEPPCCKELRDQMGSRPTGSAGCTIGNLPSIQFAEGKTALSSTAQNMLANAAGQIKANPQCNVKVIGYAASDKRAQQLSWDRVNAVIKYLVEKQGISEGRLIFTYGEMGSNNVVDLQGTMESGPNTVPAPHPNMRGN